MAASRAGIARIIGRSNPARLSSVCSGRNGSGIDMHLIQILLPIYDNEGQAFSHDIYGAIRDELVARFSGLTAFTSAPAEGLWTRHDRETKRDEIVVFEVMVADIDQEWWADYRRTLEKRLRQESVVIRSHAIRLL